MVRLEQGSFRICRVTVRPRNLIVIGFVVGLLWPAAHAQTYRVVDLSANQGFGLVTTAVINKSGVVAFYAERGALSGERFRGVYKGKTGVVTLMEDSIDHPPAAGAFQLMPSFQTGDNISLNAGGKVAWYGWKGAGSKPLVYVGSGAVGRGSFVQTSDRSTATPLTITDDGYLAYDRIVRSPSREDSAYLAPFSPIGPMNNSHQFLRFEDPPVSRMARIDLGLSSFHELVAIHTNLLPAATASGAPIVMNDNGAVAFWDSKTDGTIQTFGIYKSDGGAITPVVEMQSSNNVSLSEFNFSNGFPAFAINNNNVVVFYGRSRSLNREGFFRGPNPLTDKIVAVGDIVDGMRINSMRAPSGSQGRTSKWLNDAGQIVFVGFDPNGAGGLFVTSGVASPPDAVSAVIRYDPPISPPNSSFGVANNWKPENGDPPRVPQKTTTLNDTALFDRAEAYTVSLGLQHAQRLIVKNGNVTFNTGEITLDALAFDPASVVIDNARLTLELAVSEPALTVNCNSALIGDSGGAARVDVKNLAVWNCAGSLRVGGRTEGILAIAGGGQVTSGEARLGGAGHGHADVGADGTWTTGDLAIGIDGGGGDLTIHDGGEVVSETVVIGQEAGRGNSVLVTGAANGVATLWSTEFVLVGSKGTGRLEVKDGARVRSDLLRIGNEPGVTGAVTVNGAGTNPTISQITADQLWVASRGSVGELQIQQGGLVKVTGEQAYLGAGRGRATVTVDGIDPLTRAASTLRLDNANSVLAVGDQSSAALTISSGGLVQANPQGIVYVACDIAGEPTEIRIEGTTSKLTAGTLSVGATGSEKAIVTLVGGRVEASEAIVGAQGVIRGFGTLAVDPAARLINGGLITPGLSPGTLTIVGNYEQRFDGTLLIEIGGTDSAVHDQLIVTNEATLDGQITFRFINGFAPKTGETIDFVTAPKVNGSFVTVALQNLAPGFQFDVATNGSAMSLTALNDAVFDPSLPGSVTITITNVGGITYATAVATTANSCDSIAVDGGLIRSGNAFTQAYQGARVVSGLDCFAQVATVTNIFILGALPPGDYTFNVTSAGQSIDSVQFSVQSTVETILNPIHQSDGSIQFEVKAPDFVHSVIEASPDLNDWTALETLESGSLPGVLTDFDAVFFPQRFYRARIGPTP